MLLYEFSIVYLHFFSILAIWVTFSFFSVMNIIGEKNGLLEEGNYQAHEEVQIWFKCFALVIASVIHCNSNFNQVNT